MEESFKLIRNKAVVVRFNKEVIEGGDEQAFQELMAPDFVNATAAPGSSKGADGMIQTFQRVLRPAFPDLQVEIHDQMAEGNRPKGCCARSTATASL
jgi:predicted SnoaL-like aldol condensation-catalyzing enzyme